MNTIDYKKIKTRRQELGYNQAEMAKLVGLSNASHYQKYEDGIYKLKAEMLPKFSKALEMDIEDFFN